MELRAGLREEVGATEVEIEDRGIGGESAEKSFRLLRCFSIMRRLRATVCGRLHVSPLRYNIFW